MQSLRRVLLPWVLLGPVLLALAPSGRAQFDGHGHRIRLVPFSSPLGGASQGAAGHLRGRIDLDAVLLFGDQPSVFFKPEVYRARLDLAVAANALAVYPRWPQAPDWIFVAGPDGLTRWVWSGSGFVDESPAAQTGPWVGSTRVGVADLDGDGVADLYGVDGSENRVLLSRAVGSVWSSTVVRDFAPERVTGIAPVQWDGVGGRELAVRTDQRLYVVPFTGPPVDTRNLVGATGSLLEVVPLPQSSREAVLVFSDGIRGPNQYLEIHSLTDAGVDVDFGDLEPVSLGFADLDLDSDFDFVLSHRGAPTLQLWAAGGNGNQLHFTQGLPVPAISILDWTTVALNGASPVLGDFDYDQDPDVLFSPEGTGRVDLFNGTTTDEASLYCTVVSGTMELNSQGGIFHMVLGAPQDASASWTDVEMTVWRQPRFDYLVESMPAVPTFYAPLAPVPSTVLPVPLDIQTPYFEWFEDIYHIEARLVERQGTDVVRQGPGYTAMVGLAEPITALWELEGLPLGGDFHGVVFSVPPEFEYPFDGPDASRSRGIPLRNAGGRRPGGSIPDSPGGQGGADGTPNPGFDGHSVHYRHDPVNGTWGGGSGCLPDVPDFLVNFPPIVPGG